MGNKKDIRKIIFIVIICICVFAVMYGVYFQIFENSLDENIDNKINKVENHETVQFDKLFDNTINHQNYTINNINKIEQTKDIVYTEYTLNEIYEGKYNIKASIPIININNEKIININKEIASVFKDKITSIISSINEENFKESIYTIDYTAYINENILSLLIKSTLKEGNNAQRVIIKGYNYNLSTNEEIILQDMLGIKEKDVASTEQEIKKVIQEAVSYTDSLSSLGYNVYERDINSSIYKVENSNNYFLGPNGTIYIIYAYGNSNYTSEKDIVVIK